MVYNIMMDLDGQYALEKENFICRLKEKYRVVSGDNVSMPVSGTVVLTDRNAALPKWKDYVVIGIEHKEKISTVPYVSENLEDVTGFDMELAYARKFKLPCTVAADEEITVREMTEADVPELLTIYEDPEIVKYVPALGDMVTEIEKTRNYIQYMYGFYGYGMWIIEDNRTKRIIGRAGIEHREIDKTVYCELGYLVRKEYRGRGYGYRAARLVLGFAKEYGMEELITCIHKKNIPSARLSEKLGFTQWKEWTDGGGGHYLYKKRL